MNRRSFLAFGGAALASAAIGCRKPWGVTGTVRIGYLANLTHAPMIVALATERIARALPGVTIETRTFRAGPRVTEALLGNAIDLAVSGPGPIVAMHARHNGNPLVVLSGVASGGASLIALPSIKSPADLAGRRVASVQIGSTQDVSLRVWMAKNGLVAKERGGDVVVDAMAPANVMEQMRRGAIAAAWMTEPWATRVISEGIAVRWHDERDLWPERRFPAALLVARRPFYDARRSDAEAVARSVRDEVARGSTDSASVKSLTFTEIKRLTGKGLPPAVVDAAWSRVDYLTDPLPKELAQLARAAEELGYLPKTDVGALFV
jgi:NitT/TauT family transport system substrate-binding protein